jgi:hypothetical protein
MANKQATKQQGYPPNLSFWEKADLIPALITIVATTGYYAVRGLFGNTKHYWDYIGHAALRSIASRFSCRQCQYV